jgi:hypothetical protein
MPIQIGRFGCRGLARPRCRALSASRTRFELNSLTLHSFGGTRFSHLGLGITVLDWALLMHGGARAPGHLSRVEALQLFTNR